MPLKPSASQSQTSRDNGARSKGPITEQGKKASSQNAVRHGLRADRLQLSDEERGFAKELRRDLVARILPVDGAERAVIEGLVIVEIKLGRLDGLEMRALDLAMMDEEEASVSKRMPSLSTLDRYRGRLMRERRELEQRLERLQASRSELTGDDRLRPEALRYLADLTERKQAVPANEKSCTKEPEHAAKPAMQAHNGAR